MYPEVENKDPISILNGDVIKRPLLKKNMKK